MSLLLTSSFHLLLELRFRVIIECRDEFKYNVEAIDCLLQAQLINVQQFDLHLAAAMEQGVNYLAVHFCVSMLKVGVKVKVEQRNLACLSFTAVLCRSETGRASD